MGYKSALVYFVIYARVPGEIGPSQCRLIVNSQMTKFEVVECLNGEDHSQSVDISFRVDVIIQIPSIRNSCQENIFWTTFKSNWTDSRANCL